MQPIPQSVDDQIRHQYPTAQKTGDYLEALAQAVKEHVQVPYEKILFGQSICVDDILNTKSLVGKLPVYGPFSFGGLAGVPFVGRTGINAFLHHIPDQGSAFILCAPHIGISAGGEWGKILRHGQTHLTTCCGAAHAALEKLRAGQPAQPDPDDYQQQVLEGLIAAHRAEILRATIPLIEVTELIYAYAEQKLTTYLNEAELDCQYIVFAGGIIINTDWQYVDYFVERKRLLVEVATRRVTPF